MMRLLTFKPVEFIPRNTRFPFVRYFKFCFVLSVVLNLATVILLATVGLNYGIDFRGGTLMEVQSTRGPADVAAMRSALGALNLGETQIQSFGADNDVLIRIAEQPGGEQAQQEAVAKVRAALGEGFEVRRTEVVGGVVSSELIEQAIWALVFTCFGIFVYVWLRFEWQFALGAIIALIHDVALTVGLWSVLQLEFNLTIVAALLTILGYSINDTVVIYDRIRENLRKFKRMPLSDLLDLSVNETLSRTVMTAGSVLIALLALYFFGGEVIRGFVFAMLFGTIVGTYSSVYIAAPILTMIGIKRDWSGASSQATGRAKAPPKPAEKSKAKSPAPAADDVAAVAKANPIAESGSKLATIAAAEDAANALATASGSVAAPAGQAAKGSSLENDGGNNKGKGSSGGPKRTASRSKKRSRR